MCVGAFIKRFLSLNLNKTKLDCDSNEIFHSLERLWMPLRLPLCICVEPIRNVTSSIILEQDSGLNLTSIWVVCSLTNVAVIRSCVRADPILNT